MSSPKNACVGEATSCGNWSNTTELRFPESRVKLGFKLSRVNLHYMIFNHQKYNHLNGQGQHMSVESYRCV